MSSLSSRIQAFHQLGEYLRLLISKHLKAVELSSLTFEANDDFVIVQDRLIDYLDNSKYYNAWFTKENIEFAWNEWAELLTDHQLKNWLDSYQIPDQENPKTIGVVMAGNIPMVGFHDYLSVLLSGHQLLAKLSSDDNKLIPLLNEILSFIDPDLAQKAQFTQGQIKNFDAIIATGSNNTARYFEYYFGKYPHIIRKNRNGVAVVKGEETEEELKELGKDIFTYFGLGCRNVSKLFVPKNYEFRKLFESLEHFKEVQNHTKYYNNYEYQKAIYLVNKTSHRDNGFALFKEDLSYASPIGVVYFEEYEDLNLLKERFKMDQEQIQCIVGPEFLDFGSTQKPNLNDYADGIDTIEFLLSLNS